MINAPSSYKSSHLRPHPYNKIQFVIHRSLTGPRRRLPQGASCCLSIMASLDSQARQDIEQNIPTLDDLYDALTRRDIEQNITNVDDLYRALFQTRQDIEQVITNPVDAIQPIHDAETIDDIQKYLSDLNPAFCELSLLFGKVVSYTSCALGMDVEEWELDGFAYI
ncbi:hypothetical protein BDBG_01443 [Blastomyces gilchristii SLH14081]|uniref:Uncharacterized protein n=1 Tax=Blastomyces gilchristii (strain SLH14081) TaxID=559298 RepID=A0A179UCG0_BLAGS|nr:uncharacterized protein BDBG_01443 [Blastomyces gilchristii SLH14081]OAT04979.1 hypothetical protein BDBG_01443 [Blastomyces gilchristii SLH14081]